MKIRVAYWFLLLMLGAILTAVSGCATNEPDNASVRPWNAPQDWENSMGIMNTQHE